MPASEAEAPGPRGGFTPGEVVRVPFPYTDGRARQHRPALVLAAGAALGSPALLWVLMITSAENRGWAGDVLILDLDAAGLPAPSIVRTAKIATIDAGRAEARGRIAGNVLAAVRGEVARKLDPRLPPRSGSHAR